MNWIRWKLPPSTCAVVLIVSVFASPGHALDQEVAAGEQADEHALEHPVLARDHPLDLEQGLLEQLTLLAERRLAHGHAPCSGSTGESSKRRLNAG